MFVDRCEALAILISYGHADFIDSVDRLQLAAEEYGLVATEGQDWVQAAMAAAFRSVPR